MKLTLLLTLLIISMNGGMLYAKDLEYSVGFFSMTAKATAGTATVTGPSQRFVYSTSIMKRLIFSPGFSALNLTPSSKDMSYGIDLDLRYYPITRSEAFELSTPGLSIHSEELWRPYIGAGFMSRQFQKLSAQLAGFSVSAGIERYLNPRFNIKAEGRMGTMTGANNVKATETIIGLGLIYHLK